METFMIFLAVVAIIVFYIIYLYNGLIQLKNRVKEAWSDIDVQLKQRYDLVPNLVETVKAYAAHEKGVLETVTQARATAMQGGSIAERAPAEAALGAAVMKLMAVAENYPQLKADANFRQLQSELSDIENKIAAARRFFNNATSEYNTAIQQFPAVIIARMTGFKDEVFFELSEAEKAAVKDAPKVSFGN